MMLWFYFTLSYKTNDDFSLLSISNSTISISNHVEHSNELHDTNSLMSQKLSNRSAIGDNQNSNNGNHSLNQISNDNTCTLKQTNSSISEPIEQSTTKDFSNQNN
ncbi:unnamed protein product [Rotaria magnacalcarata]|uniref:Uncharacterized protein n=1 Tax=Rotaria magnacalcarata TaxID=392030 RepID=A0A8S3HGP2_9BILA|nr:unnamed protein product [Rotaria magnacalcarata]